ncbi:hypothetical protein [Prauserella flavalba]|uniref:Secreted protein n=1 Tax=Prauserella flavalba TaxID=1477506 RepID=A0A318LPB0_9PSEU|nr:hypothetical protein [Prauserella flavalba]PXY28847.1 hypothetical protein BA062_23755 [Prauserella flavalba]
MVRTSSPRRLRLLTALLACLVVFAAPATAAASAGPKGQLKVHATVDKSVVKVNEKVKIKGGLDVLSGKGGGHDAAGGLEPVLVQSLQAGVWVNVSTGWCRPNGGFNLSVSFDLAASLSLRVFHPETDLYASAYSGVFSLVVT